MVASGRERRQRRAAPPDGAFGMTMDKAETTSALDGKASVRGGPRSRTRGRGWLLAGVAVLVLGGLGYAFFADDGLREAAGGPIAQLVPDSAVQYQDQFEGLAAAALAAGFDADAIEMLEVLPGELPDDRAALARLREFNAIAVAAGDARVVDMRRDAAWLDPAQAARRSPRQQNTAAEIAAALDSLHDNAAMIDAAGSVDEGVRVTRATIAAAGGLAALADKVRADTSEAPPEAGPTATPSVAPVVKRPASAPPVSAPPADVPSATASATEGSVSPATAREFARIVADARTIAAEVAVLAKGRKPRRDASEEAREAYRTKLASAQSARQYVAYLDTLEASMRGTTAEAEARNSVVKASQTKAYLQALLNRSRAAQQAS